MKKFFCIFFFFIFFISFVNATTIWTTDGVKVSQAREKIEVGTDKIGGPVIYNVTDLFRITIPKNLKNEAIFFSITPTVTDYENGANVSHVSGGVGDVRYCNIQTKLDDSFGLKCENEKFNREALVDFKINNVNLIEFNSSDLDWETYLDSDGNKEVYILFNYILHSVAVETEEYATLWIDTLKCNSNYPDCLNGSKMIYVSIPTEYFVSGGSNYQIITTLDTGRRLYDSGIRMIYFSKNPDLDMVFSLEDTRKRNFKDFEWFFLGIFVSFFFSLLSNSIFQEKINLFQEVFMMVVFISALIFFGISFAGEWAVLLFLAIPAIVIGFVYKKFEEYSYSYAGSKKIKKIIKKIVKKYPKLKIIFQ